MIFLDQQDVRPALGLLHLAVWEAAFGEQPINDLVGWKDGLQLR